MLPKNMSWRLIFALSLFGLAMGFATVFVIPTRIEPYVWLGIFLVCAYLIAKYAPRRYFLHGVCVGLVNSVWVTGAHVALFDRYVAGHPREAAMAAQMGARMAGLVLSPRLMMGAVGPVIGLLSGLVLGFFAFCAGKLVVSAHSEYAGW